jgi:hypothetical protein
MTLLPVFSLPARARTPDVRRDGSVALIVFLLLGLVFAPVIGLHVALAAIGPTAVISAPDSPVPHSKRSHG